MPAEDARRRGGKDGAWAELLEWVLALHLVVLGAVAVTLATGSSTATAKKAGIVKLTIGFTASKGVDGSISARFSFRSKVRGCVSAAAIPTEPVTGPAVGPEGADPSAPNRRPLVDVPYLQLGNFPGQVLSDPSYPIAPQFGSFPLPKTGLGTYETQIPGSTPVTVLVPDPNPPGTTTATREARQATALLVNGGPPLALKPGPRKPGFVTYTVRVKRHGERVTIACGFKDYSAGGDVAVLPVTPPVFSL